jgi:hypothetical protein
MEGRGGETIGSRTNNPEYHPQLCHALVRRLPDRSHYAQEKTQGFGVGQRWVGAIALRLTAI